MIYLCAGQEARQDAEVLYEENLLFFDETRKWRDRYVVVRANHCLECHDSLEVRTAAGAAGPDGAGSSLTVCPLWCPQAFLKGAPPRQKLLPTGGAVLTTEDAYMALVDRCFPDHSGQHSDHSSTPFICSFICQEVHFHAETGPLGVAVL